MTTTQEPEARAPDMSASIMWISPKLLHPHPKNPRAPEEIEKKALAELIASIKANGQKQACLVRPARIINGFEIIIGRRRTAACEALGIDVRCEVEDLDDDRALAIMLTDHATHQDPDPLRESEAVAALLERPGWDVKKVAEQLGKSVRWAAARANLRTLTPKIRKAVKDERTSFFEWPVDWLEEIAKLTPEAQDSLLERHIYINDRERLDHFLANEFHVLGKAPWKLDDATLVPKAGSCAACPKTSLRTPGLFDEDLEKDPDIKKARCRDSVCWAKKAEAHALIQINKARTEEPKAILVRGDGYGSHEPPPPALKNEKIHDTYHLTKVPKSNPKAIPAVVVSGEKAGEKYYVLPPGTRAPVPGSKKSSGGEKEPTPAEKLKASKERVSSRRKAFVVDAIKERIEEIDDAPSFDITHRLAAAYQIEHPEDLYYGAHFEERKEIYDTCASNKEWAETVWPRLRDALVESLPRRMPDSLDEEYEAACWLAELLVIQVNEIEKKAREEIPDPRWWGSGPEAMSTPTPAKKAEPLIKPGQPIARGDLCKLHPPKKNKGGAKQKKGKAKS